MVHRLMVRHLMVRDLLVRHLMVHRSMVHSVAVRTDTDRPRSERALGAGRACLSPRIYGCKLRTVQSTQIWKATESDPVFSPHIFKAFQELSKVQHVKRVDQKAV